MKMGEMNTMNFTCQYEQAAIWLLVLSWHCGISCSPRAVPAVAFELIIGLVQLAAESQPSQKLQTTRELGQAEQEELLPSYGQTQNIIPATSTHAPTEQTLL